MAPGQLVEVVEPGRMMASSPDELIEEIRGKAARMSLVSIMWVAGAVFLVLGLVCLMAGGGERTPFLVLVGSGMAAFLCLPWAIWWDRRSLITNVYYDFDEMGSRVHEAIVRLLEGIQRANNVWSVRVEDRHGDRKRNAGADVSVDRSPVQVGWGPPARLATNVRVGHLVISGTTLYLFPDRLMIYGPGGIHTIGYADLTLEPGTVDFVEEGGVPRDAARVGTTWKFVNRDGGPDRRFKDNRQLPIMRYGVLALSSSSGMRLKLQLSTTGLAAGSAALLGVVQEAIEDLKSRGVPMGATTGMRGTEDADLPPLVAPALRAAQVGVAALEYRWLAALPEWAVPIVWGLVFALPAVAGMFLVARGRSAGTWIFMGVALLLSGCGIPVLARDRQRLLVVRAAEEAQERKDQFRELLKVEFRSKIARLVDIESLAIECEVTQDEADSVANELYRRMVDRVVADGVITSDERRKLQILAKALRMTADRWTRLEAEAASARYGQAVSDVLADGVVTPEESRMLDEMRANLGISEAG